MIREEELEGGAARGDDAVVAGRDLHALGHARRAGGQKVGAAGHLDHA